MISHEHYNSPPLHRDYSEYGHQVLANMGWSRPTDPSAMGFVWTEVLALDTAGSCGGTWNEVSDILGVATPDDSSYRLGRRLGANTVPGAVHNAFEVGALVVPPIERPPASLSVREDILLRGLADGFRRNELRMLLPPGEKTRARVEHAMQGLFAKARVRTGIGLVYWGHKVGYFDSLRYHPEPMDYYRDMSIMSRARQMLDRVFPNSADKARTLSNQVVYAMITGIPDALPHYEGFREPDRATHSKRLLAWLDNEPDALQEWVEANGTSKAALNVARTSLIKIAQEGLTFDGLQARAIEQLSRG